MGKTLTEKILSSHIVRGKPESGSLVDVIFDQTLTQDATGTMAYLEFEAMGLEKVKNELALSYVDHNTLQVGFENFDDHEYLRTIANDKGIIFSRAGNGICHQLHLERFACPGKTLIGSDSHTPTSGALASFAMGAGGLDVASAMAGLPISIIYPKVIGIKLTGKLQHGVSAKDIILKVLENFGVKGNVNTVFEYFGDGVKTLTVPERATITNMGAECGVTTSLFPSDEVARLFLRAQNREDVYIELERDIDAEYSQVYEIDLSSLSAMIALPHSPGNVKKVKEVAGLEVNQILIGSCTNSSYQDLKKVAKILKGHVVNKNISLGIAPGSRAVLRMITQDGTLDTLISAGARILESACGFCIGNGQSPGSFSVSLRTNNRNFEARSGTKDARVYLVSPETAAWSAVKGVLSDPEEIPISLDTEEVDSFLIDDSLFVFPTKEKEKIKRGPNIGNPPSSEKLKNEIRGEVLLKLGDRITTDHIMPAGAFLKYRSNIPKYALAVFNPVDPTFPKRAKEVQERGEGVFIVAGASYGQGSSREHAAICPSYLGVKAIIAISIERIHQANLCNFGILPLLFKDEKDYFKIENGDILELRNTIESVKKGEFTLYNITRSLEIPLSLFASEKQKNELILGGKLNALKEKK